MFEINKKLLKTPVEGGKILLLEPEAGLYFEMNEVSILIYQAIDDGLDEQATLQKIVNQYYVDEAQAAIDLKVHIGQLLKQSIIVRT